MLVALLACSTPERAAPVYVEPIPERSGCPCLVVAVNVHDWKNPDESAATVERLMALYESLELRGEFYLTPQILRVFQERHPAVVARLQRHVVSYHVRQPHPLVQGFGAPLQGLEPDALRDRIRDYETRRLDLRTGGLLDEPGGYAWMARELGRAPVLAGIPANDWIDRSIPHAVYKELGAKMVILGHEGTTTAEEPYVQVDGLWLRPSTVGVTRWATAGEDSPAFWWRRIHEDPEGYDPRRRLEGLVREAGQGTVFITALIHEADFYRDGSLPFVASFQAADQTPLQPPYDLDAADPSSPRSPEQAARIWSAYGEMLAWAAQHMRVVTTDDIVQMAEADLR